MFPDIILLVESKADVYFFDEAVFTNKLSDDHRVWA